MSNSYDQVPYPSSAFVRTHPDRLAATARLFGLEPPDVDGARILELGCADGGNLLPMADGLPQATLVGVDFSARQIAAGQQTIAAAGLTNVTLEHRSILDVGPELGTFEYIICHGVYSWVTPETQRKILDICLRQLSPQGVAYVSYNTYPGWRMRGMIRDMMLYHAGAIPDPKARIGQARALLDFLVKSVVQAGKEEGAYAKLLKSELEILAEQTDSYLFHDYLEDVNEPLYFHQFVDRVHAAGLMYLGDAEIALMAPSNLSPDVEKTLSQVAPGAVQIEQYMDFLRNRTFRQSLVCHQGLNVDRKLTSARARRMYFAAPIRPEVLPIVLRGSEPAKFVGRNGTAVQTPEPLVKAALVYLGRLWPAFKSFEELLAGAQELLVHGDQPYPTQDREVDGLAEALLRCLTHGMLEYRASPARYGTVLAEQPESTRLARYNVEHGGKLTNLRHEPMKLDDVERFLLALTDGTRTADDLRGLLLAAVQSGKMKAQRAQGSLDDPGVLEAAVAEHVDQALERMSRAALFKA